MELFVDKLLSETAVDYLDISLNAKVYIVFGDFQNISVTTENIKDKQLSTQIRYPEKCLFLSDNSIWFNELNKIDKSKESFILIKTPYIKGLRVNHANVTVSSVNENDNSLLSFVDIEEIKLLGNAHLQAKNIVNENSDLKILLNNNSKLSMESIYLPFNDLDLTLEQSSHFDISSDGFIKSAEIVDSRFHSKLLLKEILIDNLSLTLNEAKDVNLSIRKSLDIKQHEEGASIDVTFYQSKFKLFGVEKNIQDVFVDKKNGLYSNIMFNSIKNQKDFSDTILSCDYGLFKKYICERAMVIETLPHTLMDSEKIKTIRLSGFVDCKIEKETKNRMLIEPHAKDNPNYLFSFSNGVLTINNLCGKPVVVQLGMPLEHLEEIDLNKNAQCQTSFTVQNLEKISCNDNAKCFIQKLYSKNAEIDVNSSKLSFGSIFSKNITLKNESSYFSSSKGVIDVMSIYADGKGQNTRIENMLVKKLILDLKSGIVSSLFDDYDIQKSNSSTLLLSGFELNFKKLIKENKNIKMHPFKTKVINTDTSPFPDFSIKGVVYELLENEFPTEHVNNYNRDKVIKALDLFNHTDLKRLTKDLSEKLLLLKQIYTPKNKGFCRF